MSEEVSAFFKGFIDEGRAKFGDERVLVGTQEEENQFGLELPSFALQYLYHSNILPFGKILPFISVMIYRNAFNCWELSKRQSAAKFLSLGFV